MVVDPVSTRYAQALFESAKTEGQLEPVLEQVRMISQLMRDHRDLRQLLLNPDVDPDQKVGLLERVLGGTWSALVTSFVHLVVSFGRDAVLIDIVDALQELVDTERGQLRVRVRSARPLADETLQRLRQRLEDRERKKVELKTEVRPELLGGLQIVLGHRVIDGSVRRQLDDLRQQLQTVRVY